MTHQCPLCGKYLRRVTAEIVGDNNIKVVTGHCKTHRLVHPRDWIYEDFFPPPNGEY